MFVPRSVPLGEPLSSTACFSPLPLEPSTASYGLYTLETEWQQWPFWLSGENAEFKWENWRLHFLKVIQFDVQCIKRCVQVLNDHAVNTFLLVLLHKLTMYWWIKLIIGLVKWKQKEPGITCREYLFKTIHEFKVNKVCLSF